MVFNLTSHTLNHPHQQDAFYIKELVTTIAKSVPCVVLCMPQTRHFYNWVENQPNITLVDTGLAEVGYIISKATVFVGTDSGLKYLAYSCGVPSYIYSVQTSNIGEVLPSHSLRWLPYPQSCIPLHFNFKWVADLVVKTVDNKALCLFPQAKDNFDNYVIRRHYTVNTEKSVLQNP